MTSKRSEHLAIIKNLFYPYRYLRGILIECGAVILLMVVGYLISAMGFALWR